jgi:hypothetical protein
MLFRDTQPALMEGAKILGSEVLSAGDDFANVLYVDGVNGSDSNNGGTPSSAFATIQAAVTAGTIYTTIFIRPKYPLQGVNQGQPNVYAENIVIPVTKTGMKLIGMPFESDPYMSVKIKPTDTAAHVMLVNASGVTLQNLCIMNQASSTAGVFLSWQGTTYNAAASSTSNLEYVGSCGANIINCEFREGHDDPAVAGPSIVIRGGYNSVIRDCTFVAGATHQAIQLGDDISPSRNHKIINCNFHDNNGAAATRYIGTGSGANHGIVIKGCTFGIATTFVVVAAGNSGIIADCYFADTAATLAKSTGKVQVPADQCVSVTGCWGGVSLAVIQSAA